LLTSDHRYIIGQAYFLQPSKNNSPDAGLTDWTTLNMEVLDYCTRVWQAVQHVLCSDAPEGYHLEDEEGNDSGGGKEMLSFCWRALKESRWVFR